jgi:hypothetical protein
MVSCRHLIGRSPILILEIGSCLSVGRGKPVVVWFFRSTGTGEATTIAKKSQNTLCFYTASPWDGQQVSAEVIVRDHVDCWAKNKRRFGFHDMWFIFNLHTRNIFFYIGYTHIIYRIFRACMNNLCGEKITYLECRLFVHGCKPKSLLLPCSKPTAPFESSPSPLRSSLFHCPLPPNTMFFTYRHINPPNSSSVGHTLGSPSWK